MQMIQLTQMNTKFKRIKNMIFISLTLKIQILL